MTEGALIGISSSSSYWDVEVGLSSFSGDQRGHKGCLGGAVVSASDF